MTGQIKTEKISELTINRLSIYLRCLNALAVEGTATVSSQILAERFGLNSAQIRKDLAYFGEFGVRGVGYYVDDLRTQIRTILGLDFPHRLAIIGAGNLGMALANYDGFRGDNFTVVAMFDNGPDKVGTASASGVPVYPVERLGDVVASKAIDIAAIAVPGRAAQAALDEAVSAGIRAVLNFAPARITGPPGVKIRNVDLTISLEGLSYSLGRPHGVATDVDLAGDAGIVVAGQHETV